MWTRVLNPDNRKWMRRSDQAECVARGAAYVALVEAFLYLGNNDFFLKLSGFIFAWMSVVALYSASQFYTKETILKAYGNTT